MFHGLTGLRYSAFAQQKGRGNVVGPLRARIQLDKIAGPIESAQLHECPGAGTELIVARSQGEGSVALPRGFLEHAGITLHITQGEMGLGVLRTPLGQRRSRLEGLSQLAPIHPVHDQLRGGGNQVGIKSQGAFQGGIRVLEHLLAAIRVSGVVVITLPYFGPGGGVVGVQFDHVFQRLDRFPIGSGVVGQGHAAQIKIVGFLIIGPRAGFQKAAGSAQHGQQTLADLFGELLLHSDQVLGGAGQIGLP